MKIGDNLKKLRKQAKLTQQEVSEMLGFKNHTGYAHWEGDRNSPSLLDLERIAEVFGVTIFDVLTIAKNPDMEVEAKIELLEKENVELRTKNEMLEGLVLRAMGKCEGVTNSPKLYDVEGSWGLLSSSYFSPN